MTNKTKRTKKDRYKWKRNSPIESKRASFILAKFWWKSPFFRAFETVGIHSSLRGNLIPEGRQCYREGMLPRSWLMALFNQRKPEYPKLVRLNWPGGYYRRQAVPQITRAYAMKCFIGNNWHLELYPEANWQPLKLAKQRHCTVLPKHTCHYILDQLNLLGGLLVSFM